MVKIRTGWRSRPRLRPQVLQERRRASSLLVVVVAPVGEQHDGVDARRVVALLDQVVVGSPRHVVERRAVESAPRSPMRLRQLARAGGRSARAARGRRSRVLPAARARSRRSRRPTSSSALNWSSDVDRRLLGQLELRVARSSAACSPIEPDTSMTSSTAAPLRCVAHRVEQPGSTAGFGQVEHASGAGRGRRRWRRRSGRRRRPSGLPGRKPYCNTCCWFSGCWTKSSNCARRLAASALTHGASSTIERVVGEERCLPSGRSRRAGCFGVRGFSPGSSFPSGLPVVVVDDRLLLDGDRRRRR